MSVQLRLLDKADKEIVKLPRSVKGAIYDFQRKFRQDPANRPAVQAAQGRLPAVLGAGERDYRALLLQVKDESTCSSRSSRAARPTRTSTGTPTRSTRSPAASSS